MSIVPDWSLFSLSVGLLLLDVSSLGDLEERLGILGFRKLCSNDGILFDHEIARKWYDILA